MGKESDDIFDEAVKVDRIIRTFGTGANRDTNEGKLDYEACLSPLVLERYAQYMDEHDFLPDGSRRGNDNWQKGMPLVEYMKSGWRHFKDWWTIHRGWNRDRDDLKRKKLEDAICGVLFNASGYLHEILKGHTKDYDEYLKDTVDPSKHGAGSLSDVDAAREVKRGGKAIFGGGHTIVIPPAVERAKVPPKPTDYR